MTFNAIETFITDSHDGDSSIEFNITELNQALEDLITQSRHWNFISDDEDLISDMASEMVDSFLWPFIFGRIKTLAQEIDTELALLLPERKPK